MSPGPGRGTAPSRCSGSLSKGGTNRLTAGHAGRRSGPAGLSVPACLALKARGSGEAPPWPARPPSLRVGPWDGWPKCPPAERSQPSYGSEEPGSLPGLAAPPPPLGAARSVFCNSSHPRVRFGGRGQRTGRPSALPHPWFPTGGNLVPRTWQCLETFGLSGLGREVGYWQLELRGQRCRSALSTAHSSPTT